MRDHGPADFDEAFDALVALAYRVAFRILGDREEARDVAQEALTRAFSRWSRVRGYAPAWVSRVAANLALDRVRRVGVAARAPRPTEVASLDAAEVVAQRAELVAGLSALPRRQREVVVLRHVADRSEAEVAELLGCSVGTVKRHAHRGLAALRLALDPAGDPATDPDPDPDADPDADPIRPAPIAAVHPPATSPEGAR